MAIFHCYVSSPEGIPVNYQKSPFIVDFPMNNGGSFQFVMSQRKPAPLSMWGTSSTARAGGSWRVSTAGPLLIRIACGPTSPRWRGRLGSCCRKSWAPVVKRGCYGKHEMRSKWDISQYTIYVYINIPIMNYVIMYIYIWNIVCIYNSNTIYNVFVYFINLIWSSLARARSTTSAAPISTSNCWASPGRTSFFRQKKCWVCRGCRV